MTTAIEQLIKMHDPRCVSAESMNVGRGRASLTREQILGAFAAAQHQHSVGLDLLMTKYRNDFKAEQRLRDAINEWVHQPVSRMMDEIRGYGQMVGQLNQPDRAAFLNNMVNPPDKTASREEAKGLRRDLLDVGQARAKALAGAMDKDAMAEINSQYDQLQNQVLQTYGQPGKAADSFDDFAIEYQKENGAPPDPKNEQDTQFYQQWKTQKQGGTPPGAPATTTSQGQAPSQLPDNSYAAGYLREMRQQAQRQQQ